MKTRLLRPEENWKSNLTMAVAFEGDYDLEKAKESAARERTEEEKREDARNRCFCTFLDDDETICGVVNSREYLCRFDGGTYKLGGVGGVSTLPQYRRGGVIRACVTASLKDMYANDFTFAFLYPFSMQYYRKFGFEAGAPEYRWSVPFTAMKPQDVGGHVEQIFPGGDFTPLLTVYNTFYADHNLSAVRETYDKGLEKANLWNDKRYVFVWYNNENQPRGLMITHKIEEGGVTYLDCTHTFQSPGGFLACDAEAFNGLLFFAKSAFSSDYEKLRFTVPSDMHLEQLIGENTRTFCSVFPNGMLRVVNVERVLENCACRGTGEITSVSKTISSRKITAHGACTLPPASKIKLKKPMPYRTSSSTSAPFLPSSPAPAPPPISPGCLTSASSAKLPPFPTSSTPKSAP